MKINFRKAAFMLAICCLTSSLPLSATSLMNSFATVNQIITDMAPKAIGPYSQAVCAGDSVFVSGQIALDPTSNKLAGRTIEEQTKQVLKNIEAILVAQGLTLENVVKADVYLKDLKDFAAMNTVYAEKFSYKIKPARATVQIAKLPLDALVEISCVAFIPQA